MILTDSDWSSWEEDGYVVVPGIVSEETLVAIQRAIWEFTGKVNTPNGWYQGIGNGMVNMAHHQSLWDARQTENVYQVFSELWDTHQLSVTINCTNFNPPERGKWSPDGFIHWDLDLSQRPLRPYFQGVLCLNDTSEEMGGFQCIPGSHRRVMKWDDDNNSPTKEAIMGDQPIHCVPGRAGDLIVWHQALLHGNGRNVSNRSRLAQYICMTPDGTARTTLGQVDGGEELRKARGDTWRHGANQRTIADALAVPEGFVEVWLRGMLNNEAPEQRVCKIPHPKGKSLLTDAQRDELVRQLQHQTPWQQCDIVSAKSMSKKYGTTASYLAAALLSKHIVTCMAEISGLDFDAQPAQLTPLGKKLLGVEAW